MVKNPIACDLNLWIGAVERLIRRDVTEISLINSGFTIYPKKKYRNEPIWEISEEKKKVFPELPMLCDPSHISGNQKYLDEVINKAISLSIYNGLMIEVHNNPEDTQTDSKQHIKPAVLKKILTSLNSQQIMTANQNVRL